MRVLIVDDREVTLHSLQRLLLEVDDIEIVGTTEDGYAAISLIEKLSPDVILINIEMPEMKGIQLTKFVAQRFSQVKILVLTTCEKEEYARKAIDAGADDYVLKETPVTDLIEAIRYDYKDFSHYNAEISNKSQYYSSNSHICQKTDYLAAKKGEVENHKITVDEPNLDVPSKSNKRYKSRTKLILFSILICLSTALTLATLIYGISQIKAVTNKPKPAQTAKKNARIAKRRISSLGTIKPSTDVIKVSVPAAMSNDRIAALYVKRGDFVKSGQVIAVLDSRQSLENALSESKAQLRVSQAKLEQIVAGASPAEIMVQKAEILRLKQEEKGEIKIEKAIIDRRQVEVDDAKAEYERYSSLYRENAIAASEVDQRKLTFLTSQAQIEEAKESKNQKMALLQEQIKQAQANLDKISTVRPTDIAVAQSEVDREIILVKKAQDALNEAYIKVPTEGRIFDVKAQPGEVVGTDGIVEMGKTSQMEVIAEIYESDINQVRVGKQATIISDSFPEKLKGIVTQVGLQVIQQQVSSGDSGENLDRKIIEVRIKLNSKDSQRVSNLTNMQVRVLI